MTPKEFADAMKKIADNGDTEYDHMDADDLMIEVLTSLGYGEGAEIFDCMDKWYS